MNLLSGLENFGFDTQKMDNLFEEEKKESSEVKENVSEERKVQETDFLLEKGVRCPICDKVFKTLMVKSGRLKRLEPDSDLRPRHQDIDSLKYDISSCPHCGYTAINRYFEHVTSVQRKLIQDGICSKFKPEDNVKEQEGICAIDYDTALARYKLSLFNTIVKKGANSEKAFTCLKISWLLRGMQETLPEDATEEKKTELQKEEQAFYVQAFDGFFKAISSEMFPMCGMDQTTVDYLLAAMAMRLHKYDVAAKLISGILTSPAAPSRIKNKALNMKSEIIAAIHGAT